METRRRDFLKMMGLAGVSFLGGCGSQSHAGQGQGCDGSNIRAPGEEISGYAKKHKPGFNMSGFAASPIETVRIGIIGLGQRGPSHMRIMSRIEGVQIKGELHF